MMASVSDSRPNVKRIGPARLQNAPLSAKALRPNRQGHDYRVHRALFFVATSNSPYADPPTGQ